MNLLIWLVVIAAAGAAAYYFLVMKKKGASPLAKPAETAPVHPSFTQEEESEE